MGILYIVPTPIGNLSDITFRAVEILKSVGFIYCEDTRHSGILLKNLGIKNKLRSLHKYNEASKVDEIQDLLDDGVDIAVISDAGTPGISDPCELLVKSVHAEVICLPGPTAFVPALVASGLDAGRFTFVGFLPQKKSDRDRELESLKNISHTLIFYESPHRINETLAAMEEIFGDRNISIAREISKIYEEHIKTTLHEAKDMEFRGELVIVVQGAEAKIEDFRDLAKQLKDEGLRTKDIVKKVMERNPDAKRNDIYNYLMELDHGRQD
uniref:16S rRNA (cytidine(1402)-2'-O)-methyltransferase n=1 Tax=Ezakiella massiliensis TaxID=1852374 RepID=UPI00094F24B1|nr:16S rRNA (cytidine(1402)-2'-O)-methyltransferase [Ezakiella massiliensis]